MFYNTEVRYGRVIITRLFRVSLLYINLLCVPLYEVNLLYRAPEARNVLIRLCGVDDRVCTLIIFHTLYGDVSFKLNTNTHIVLN